MRVFRDFGFHWIADLALMMALTPLFFTLYDAGDVAIAVGVILVLVYFALNMINEMFEHFVNQSL